MPARRGLAAGYPSINLWQDGDDAYAEAELPGLSIEDIEVLVTGKELTISGERKNPADLPNASYHRRERGLGRFSRTMMLPWEIDAGKVEAKLVNGVLTVKLPKCEACKPKKVKLLSA